MTRGMPLPLMTNALTPKPVRPANVKTLPAPTKLEPTKRDPSKNLGKYLHKAKRK